MRHYDFEVLCTLQTDVDVELKQKIDLSRNRPLPGFVE